MLGTPLKVIITGSDEAAFLEIKTFHPAEKLYKLEEKQSKNSFRKSVELSRPLLPKNKQKKKRLKVTIKQVKLQRRLKTTPAVWKKQKTDELPWKRLKLPKALNLPATCTMCFGFHIFMSCHLHRNGPW